MPSLRQTRKSSRTSSPAVRPAADSPANTSEAKKEKAQTTMDTWVEPPLKPPAPSFEDHGLERHSLFEQMAPLGTIPKASGDKIKMKLDFSNKKARKSGAVKAVDGASATPELTPPIEQKTTPKQPELARPAVREKTEEKDSEYVPNGSGAAVSTPKSAPKATTPARNGTSSTSHSRQHSTSKVTATTERGPRIARDPELSKKLEAIIQNAVNRANEQGQPIVGQACVRIYEDSHYDQEKATLVTDVLLNKETDAQREAFAILIIKARKAIKAEENAKRRAQRVASSATSQRASSLTDKPTPTATPSNTTTAPLFPPPSPHGLDIVATPEPQRTGKRSSAAVNGDAAEPVAAARAEPAAATNTNGMGTRLRSRPSRSAAVPQPVETTPKAVAKNTTPVTNGRGTRSSRRRSSTTSSLSSVDDDIVNEGPPPPSLGAGAKRTAAEAGLPLDDDEELNTRRKRLVADFNARQLGFGNIPTLVSDIRGSPAPVQQKSGITLNFTGGGRTTRSNKRVRDDSNPLDSPLLSPNPQGLGGSGANTRSGRSLAPSDASRPVKKSRTGARTKISPVKDRSTVAGVPRNNGHGMNGPGLQGSPSRGNVTDEETDDENSDVCVACGEAGELICCDGCENAFHFKCCDPPLKAQTPILNEAYFCYSCTERSKGRAAPEGGIFGPLLDDLKSTNVQSFQVPKEVRTYFDCVVTKENGEYHDNSEPRQPVGKTRTGNTAWEELGENGKAKEKDKLMRCKICLESSITGRTIIQCDVCQNQWHIDCLDPPQANPPAVSANGKTRAFFRCPLHISGDLRLIGNPAMAFKNPDGSAARGHKLRRARSPIIITPTIQRGNKNNGMIEVDLSEDDEPAPIEQEDGVVYKLSASAIRLDFIAKVKQQRAEKEARKNPASSLSTLNPKIRTEMQEFISSEVSRQVDLRVQEEMRAYRATQRAAEHDFLNRPLKEQRMALFLTRFGQEHADAQYGVDKENLDTLARAISSADPVDTISTISVNDLKQLQNFITQAIDKSSENGKKDDDDLFDEDSAMTEADEANDTVETEQEPVQPASAQLIPPRSSQGRSRSLALERSESPESSFNERSKSVPMKAEDRPSPPFTPLLS